MINAMTFIFIDFSPLDGDVQRRPSYGVYISKLIRFARVFSHLDDFNARNKYLTTKLLKQGYHKLRQAFSKFIVDTMNWFQTPMSASNFFNTKAYRNQNFTVLSIQILKNLWVGLIFLISFEK